MGRPKNFSRKGVLEKALYAAFNTQPRVLKYTVQGRARGRVGGRPPKLTRSELLRAQAAMRDKGTVVVELAKEIEVSTDTLYRLYGSPR
jgi:hypothetical protein